MNTVIFYSILVLFGSLIISNLIKRIEIEKVEQMIARGFYNYYNKKVIYWIEHDDKELVKFFIDKRERYKWIYKAENE